MVCRPNSRKVGSSPRGRGTHPVVWPRVIGRRFIPAWAGNTSAWLRRFLSASVHPRVGGEHWPSAGPGWGATGSSPRGRGTPGATDRRENPRRFIPAWAGNTPDRRTGSASSNLHPRVGGEHPLFSSRIVIVFGSSPRGRGTQTTGPGGERQIRFIPAWAGNTNEFRKIALPKAVHPRVGGEHGYI